MVMRALPLPFDSLRFMGKRFTVEQHDGPPLGLCDFDRCRVSYNADQSPQQLQETLIHELLHVIDFALELKLRHKQVQGLGAGLHALIRDNPDYARWLLVDYSR